MYSVFSIFAYITGGDSMNSAFEKRVLKNFKPMYKSKQAYFEKVDRIFRKRILPETDYRDEKIEEIFGDGQ